jgi:hypothetical protein
MATGEALTPTDLPSSNLLADDLTANQSEKDVRFGSLAEEACVAPASMCWGIRQADSVAECRLCESASRGTGTGFACLAKALNVKVGKLSNRSPSKTQTPKSPMPKKVQPRWAAMRDAEVPDFKLSADQVAALAKMIEIHSPAAMANLKPSLEQIGVYYLRGLQQDEKGPSRAEQNAALRRVIRSGRELSSTLARLDDATHGRLLDALMMQPVIEARPVIEQLNNWAAAVDHAVECATLALATGQKGGPSPRITLPIIIGFLASVYEEATGLEFTHTPYADDKYQGAPQSQAGRFGRNGAPKAGIAPHCRADRGQRSPLSNWLGRRRRSLSRR